MANSNIQGCPKCGARYQIGQEHLGRRLRCAKCGAVFQIEAELPRPADEIQTQNSEEFVPPTEKQIAFAQKLGLLPPKGVTRQQLSNMIELAKENSPATESQKEFLRDLGITFPPDIKSNQISMLLDAATDIRDQVSSGIVRQYEEQLKAAGMLVEHLSDDALLEELGDRGKSFVVLMLDDDEFRYQSDRPIKGSLRWSESLTTEDVQFVFTILAAEWASKLNIKAYCQDFDGTPPSVDIDIPD